MAILNVETMSREQCALHLIHIVEKKWGLACFLGIQRLIQV